MSKKRSPKQIIRLKRQMSRIAFHIDRFSALNVVQRVRVEGVQNAVSEVSLALDTLESAIHKGNYPANRAFIQLLNEFRTLDRLLTSAIWSPRGGVSRERKIVTRDLVTAMNDLKQEIEKFEVPKSRFQQQLEYILAEYNLTAYALATMAGVDESNIYKLKNGYRDNPSRALVKQLAEVLIREFPAERTKRDCARLFDSAGYQLDRRSRSDKVLIPAKRFRLPWN